MRRGVAQKQHDFARHSLLVQQKRRGPVPAGNPMAVARDQHIQARDRRTRPDVAVAVQWPTEKNKGLHQLVKYNVPLVSISTKHEKSVTKIRHFE